MSKTQTTSPAPERDDQLRRRAEETGDELRGALEALLAELSRRGVRDQRGLQGALTLSQSVVSRLVASVRGGDPLATLRSTPGPEALRQMVRGATQSGVEAGCIARMEHAVARLESFLEAEVGDRGKLDALLSDWVHESRAAFELRHKQAAFKAMSALRGVRVDALLNAAIIHPSAGDPQVYDSIGIDALLGCGRIRPRAELRLVGWQRPPAGTGYRITNLAGAPIESTADMLLGEFSTITSSRFTTTRHEHTVQTVVTDLPLSGPGERGEDLVCAQMYRGLQRARRAGGAPSSGVGGQAEPPAEVFVVDALLHEDVWPELQPELRIFDTVVRGIAHPDDPEREGDRLDLQETVQFLGTGPAAFRLPEFPRYGELVRHLCAQAGWDASKLRGFRCKVRYPIHGAQIGLSFPLPD